MEIIRKIEVKHDFFPLVKSILWGTERHGISSVKS